MQVVNCPQQRISRWMYKKKKSQREALTRLVGHDRVICSANADAHLLIVNDTEVWVNANAVG
jgi:hypothetical protein